MKEQVLLADLHPHKNQPDRDGVEGLAKSIMSIGLVEPIVVAPSGNKFTIVTGHRRVEAVRGLGWDAIDAIILEGNVDEATTTLQLLASNMQRQDFSEMEIGQLAQTLFDLEQTPAQVADITGFTQKEVKVAAKTYAALKEAPAVSMNMTLEEATLYAKAAPYEDMVSQLNEDRGTTNWDHTARNIYHAIERRQEFDKLVAEAEQQGLTIVKTPKWDDKKVVSLHKLCPKDVDLDEFATKHAEECEGHAVYITDGYEIQSVLCCTDALTHHDYKGRPVSDHEEKERAQARAGREFKNEMKAPTEVRRQWIKDVLLKKKVTKGEWEFIAYALANRNSHTTDLALELAHSKRTPSDGNHSNYNRDFVGKPEPKSRILALAMIIACMDEETRLCQGTDHFRATHIPHYLTYLKKNGYVLSKHEEKFLCGD